MTALRRMFDPLGTAHDFAFPNNNLTRTVGWDDAEADGDGTTDAVVDAVTALTELWFPRVLRVGVGSFDEYGSAVGPETTGAHPLDAAGDDRPAAVARTLRRACADLAAVTAPGRASGIRTVDCGVDGWVRVGVPEGADVHGPWRLVCEDGFLPRAYQLVPAPPLAGHATVWLRLLDAGSSSHLIAYVEGTGSARATLTLGPNVFAPVNDPRPGDTPVRGVPLAAWRTVNHNLLGYVLALLHRQGWTS